MTFDLAIIGGGPAGYTAAEKAAKMRKNVILFENSHLGGVCLNEGCIPTKTLLYSSKVYQNSLNGKKYAVLSDNVTFNYEKVVARKNKVVRKLSAGIRAKMRENQITVVEGEATPEMNGDTIVVRCGEFVFSAEHLLLCTGSSTVLPPIKGLSPDMVWTSREALETKTLPISVVLIGGGVIGMEFAALFSAFGVDVCVVEMASEILPGFDSEIAAMLRAEYAKKGVRFHLGAKVTEIAGKTVIFSDENGQNSVDAEQILVCVGRKPNFEIAQQLGLEFLDKKLKLNAQMQTSVKTIYAAGDITGVSLLAHTAIREAEVAVNAMFGIPDEMDYSAIPSVVYTDPEVASVGKTEADFINEGRICTVYKKPMTYSGRFVAENEGFDGLCKLIADEKGVLAGAQLIGNPASEIISVAAMAIQSRMSVQQFQKIIFPHPSVSEIFKETVGITKDYR